MTRITLGDRSGTVMYLDDDWQPVSADEATLAKVHYDDGTIAFYTVGDKVKALSRKEREIHAIADSFQSKVEVAIRYAFAVGRKAIDRKRLDAAKSVRDVEVATKNVSDTVEIALMETLPSVLSELAASAGGSSLKTLGGPGSGNFGHAGRPGEVGGSAPSEKGAVEFGSDVRAVYPSAPDLSKVKIGDIESIGEKLLEDGHIDDEGFLAVYHVTASDPDQILREGLIPGKETAPGQDWAAEHAKFATYFFRSKEHALDQAEQGGEGFTVIKAQLAVTEETLRRLVPDEDTGMKVTEGVKALIRGENIGVIGGVPGHQLSVIKKNFRAGAEGDFTIRKRISVPRKTKLTPPKFDTSRAQDWAERHVKELAKGLAKTTRNNVINAVEQAFEDIDKGKSWKSVQSSILEAVGDDARAQAIAQTEIMAAANAGQRISWEQQVESGYLSGKEKRVWVTFPNACPLCDELEGETADLDGAYPDGIEGPPLHPRCRCIEELR